MRQTTLAIGCLFGQDVTLEGMLALDLSSAGQLEALLCAGLGFHLRHNSFDLGLLISLYFFLIGAIKMNIRLPSKWGRASTLPRSDTS